jgi:Uma2 family endonuclease
VVVNGYRTTTRIPDLMVLSEDLANALSGAKRSVVMPDMPPPVLVVEIVSLGTANEERDYRYKRPLRYLRSSAEHAARGIAEYWIVDPHSAQVTVLTLVAGLYEEAVFRDGNCLISPILPGLAITATEIFQAGVGLA